MNSKMSSAKWRPFCHGVLTLHVPIPTRTLSSLCAETLTVPGHQHLQPTSKLGSRVSLCGCQWFNWPRFRQTSRNFLIDWTLVAIMNLNLMYSNRKTVLIAIRHYNDVIMSATASQITSPTTGEFLHKWPVTRKMTSSWSPVSEKRLLNLNSLTHSVLIAEGMFSTKFSLSVYVFAFCPRYNILSRSFYRRYVPTLLTLCEELHFLVNMPQHALTGPEPSRCYQHRPVLVQLRQVMACLQGRYSPYRGSVIRSFDVVLLLHEHCVEQTIDLPVIWDVMTPMWRHCNMHIDPCEYIMTNQ